MKCKGKLLKYGPLIISIGLLAISLIGVVAAETYTPHRTPVWY